MHSVRLTRKLSIMSSVLSTVSIAAFIVIYNMEFIYYFPAIWSVSILCFVFNFVRNRQYASEKCCYSTFCRRIRSINRTKASPDDHMHDSLPSTVLQLASTASTIYPTSNRNTLNPQPRNPKNKKNRKRIEETVVVELGL